MDLLQAATEIAQTVNEWATVLASNGFIIQSREYDRQQQRDIRNARASADSLLEIVQNS